MRAFKKKLLALAISIACTLGASAQYYELANQLTNLISPALSGSARYKGFVDLSGVAGFGDNRANFIELSTSQGFQYASWFFMGAGLGIDVAMAHNPGVAASPSSAQTMAMLPVFSDFRFNIGNGEGAPSFFADLKLGAAWFLGNRYFTLQNGTMSHSAQFYLKPTIGIRVPINAGNTRQALNFGVSYQLLTSNNNWSAYGQNGLSLNSIGATIGFEW